MLEAPKLAKERIIAQLSASYDLHVQSLEFLPVGNDARAWSYRVETAAGLFFLKLRKGQLNPASLLVPHYLRVRGIDNIVAPLPAKDSRLFARLEDYALTLYPYIQGESKWDMTLSPAQWRQWGRIMRAIHSAPVAPALAQAAPQEVYAVKWLDKLDRIEAVLERGDYAGEVAQAVAEVWRENADVIERCRRRYRSLGAKMERLSLEFVLCHADIHPANIIIDANGAINIVDWDETLLAPRERDLMFFIDDGRSDDTTAAFLAGYDDCAVDPLALAYYKYDWVIQELGDYGERVFLLPALGKDDLALSRREFARLFAADDVIARAHRAYANLLAQV